MATYTLVNEAEIKHKNEYYEIRISRGNHYLRSLFFITNEEDLQQTARRLLQEQRVEAPEWQLIPHQKK